jgi:single-strand DNA-binding protein
VASVNKAIILGNLGKDPDVRYTQGGQAVCNFSVATNEKWTKDGQSQERTEWHKVVAWGKTAELCGQYLKKGRSVFIEGRIQTREYEKDGQKRYSTEIVADRVQFIGGRGEDSGGSGSRSSDDFGPTPSSGGSDEDIPF